jgi:hypothetical protein
MNLHKSKGPPIYNQEVQVIIYRFASSIQLSSNHLIKREWFFIICIDMGERAISSRWNSQAWIAHWHNEHI